MQISKLNIKKILLTVFLFSMFSYNALAWEVLREDSTTIPELSAKTNLDSTDVFLIAQGVDSANYKVLFDRIVDSVEDSIRGNIINAWIKSGAAIALNKLASGTAAYIVMANVSGVPTYTAVSGDATISNAGVVTIAANSVGSSEITNDQIVNADINSAAAIVYSKLNLTASIVSADIVDGTIVTADISDGTITGTDIQDESISTSDIDDGTIANSDISSSAAISLSKLEAGTEGQILIGDEITGILAYKTVSGDATINFNGGVDLADNLSDNFSYTGSASYPSESFTPSGSTTLSAAGVKNMLCQLDANTATITDISGGSDGQIINIINSHSSTFSMLIDHGAEINLDAQTDRTLDPGEAIMLTYVASVDMWYQVGK